MSPKQSTERRRGHVTEGTRAKKSARKSSARALKESRTTYQIAAASLEEINQNLLQLQSGLAEIRQRLAMFEARLSTLSEAQRQIAAMTMTTADDLGWLRLSESSFAFWDNAEDDIYDTL